MWTTIAIIFFAQLCGLGHSVEYATCEWPEDLETRLAAIESDLNAANLRLAAVEECSGCDGDTCNIEINIDRLGSDMNVGLLNIVDSPEVCCEQCKNTDGCKAWTFDKRLLFLGSCWLKSGVPAQTPNQCCDSGVIN
ncbi:uncharacterized protein LOC144450292 [Glandiceps talaboti]